MPRWFRIYLGVVAALFYLEFAVGTTYTIHLPPAPEPDFMKPVIIIIVPESEPQPNYDNDEWHNTWDEYYI